MRLLSFRLPKQVVCHLLVLFLFPLSLLAQNRSISGVVKDAKGAGVPSVTVAVKGSQVATATSATGTFTINAAKNAILQFSAVGFESAEFAPV